MEIIGNRRKKTFLLKYVVYSASIKKKRNAHHAKTQEVVQKYYAMNILNLPSFSACLSFEVWNNLSRLYVEIKQDINVYLRALVKKILILNLG